MAAGASSASYRVSLDNVAAAGGAYERLRGDYFLTIPSAPKAIERWEVNFPAVAGYDRLGLEIGPGTKPGTRKATLAFGGAGPSPVWSQDNVSPDAASLQLTLEPGSGPAGVGWPSSISVEKLVQRAPVKAIAPSAVRPLVMAASSSGMPPPAWPPQGGPCDDSPPPPPGTCPKMPPNNPPCSSGTSSYPVKYFNGELQISETDLSTSGYGRAWGHTRTYSNQLASTYNFGNGYNWVVVQWPYLALTSPTTIAAMQGANFTVWFDLQPDGSYVARYGAKQTLTHFGSTYQLALTTGEVVEFNDFNQTVYPPGSFKSLTIAGGDTLAVTAYDGNQVAEAQRTLTRAGQTIAESFLYTYLDSGNNAGNLAAVTLRRSSDGGPWSNVLQAVYTYYDLNDPNGSLGDLCTATQQVPSGTGWADTSTSYYRYYTGSQAHLLKYVVGPSGYAALAAKGNPLLASDAQVAQVATHYLQYDNLNRVTLESVNGGTLTSTFDYHDSGYTANTDYAAWTRRTTESRPDGSQMVVYTNYIRLVLLKSLQSAGSQWTEFYQYDSDGREISKAHPSAVSGYSEGSPPGTLNVNLQSGSGKFSLTEYYQPPDPAAGYVKSKSLRQGTGGAPVPLMSFTYMGQTVGVATVQKLASQTVYTGDDGTGAITTSYGYAWYAGTLQVRQKTTALPVVPFSQNGFNTADTQREYYDTLGQMTWEQGPRGFIDNLSYDSVTGGRVQMIEDVDPAQTPPPAGWSRPTGLPAPLNLVSDYELDARGRTTQVLGPSHLIDGVAVRTATWTVFGDPSFSTISARGYATGLAPKYVYTSLGPVSITITNASGQPTDTIQAAESALSGKLSGTNTFPQSTWTSWATSLYDDAGRLIARRGYYAIPETGDGTPDANFNETQYGYDAMGRPNRLVTPGGTVTRKVYDARGNLLTTYVGTDDYGALDTDPTAAGAPGNNMVPVTQNHYDGDFSGGDGNLTQTTAFVDSIIVRVTQFGYDWRDRQISTTGELNFFQQYTYDNLDRVVQSDRYVASAGGRLLSRSQTRYDARGNVYQTAVYGIDPNTGTVGNVLTNNLWYDAAGNQIKRLPAGSQAFTKTMYDSQARAVASYIGYYTGSGAEPIADVPRITANNKIFEQTLTSYDPAGNAIENDFYQRNHNATGNGALNATYTGTQPLARTSYTAAYFDGIGRQVATANYGTNGAQQFIRATTVPALSDTVLVTLFGYDDAGNPSTATDPAGSITLQTFDAVQQVRSTISNYTGGCPGNDHDVTVQFSYNSDGKLVTLTAVNPTTGNQVTTYQYGTTLADSAIASNLLLAATIYPDASDSNDRVMQTYNRQGQVTGATDQNGTAHEYLYDLLGRQTDDIVTTLGSGVDATVQRIGQNYNDLGLVYQVTSYADPAGTTVVNQVQNEYNAFQQLVTQFQEHAGAVDPASSPQVDYSHADGSANTIRQTALAYPNGRVISYGYGASGGDGDMLSRIASYFDVAGGITLVNYTYLGLNSFVQVGYPQASITYNLATGSGNDPYSGLDPFGRVIDALWQGPSSTLAEIQYGYNRASSRIWRKDPVAASQSPPVYQDELYTYDGLQRLVDMSRGQLQLNSSPSGRGQGEGSPGIIASLALAQQWHLDATGNWSQFVSTDVQDATNNLDLQRNANAVNEITAISQRYGAAWAQPAYDRNGNMTAIPQPNAPTASFAATYDAWNRLTSLAGTAVYAYDGLDRRVSKLAAGENRDYYYSSMWQVLEERVGALPRSATRAPGRRVLAAASFGVGPERQLVWGLRYVDDLVLRDRAVRPGPLTERLYALSDANWNVIANADQSGIVSERCCYTPYGMPTFLDPSFNGTTPNGISEWRTLYCSYHFDAMTGLYNVRHRFLHPAVGGWVARDPAEIITRMQVRLPRSEPGPNSFDGDISALNGYSYVDCDPLDRIDPLGLYSCTPCVTDCDPPFPDLDCFFIDVGTSATTYCVGNCKETGFSPCYAASGTKYTHWLCVMGTAIPYWEAIGGSDSC